MTTPTVEQTPPSRSAAGHRRVALALALLAMALLGPAVARQDASSWSRTALTGGVVEDWTVDLEDFPIGVDRVVYDGEIRSDKAPGQPVFAAPFHAVYRAFGGESAKVERAHENLGLWWQTLWVSAVPFAGLLALMYLAASRVDRRTALPAAFAVGFGTLMLPFADHLYGHILSALAVFASWLLVRERPSPRAALAAGALAGFAAITEYQVALVVVIVGGALALHARDRLMPFVLGGAPFAVFAGVYHWIVVGNPLRVPYSLKDVHEGGIVGISFPQPEHLLEIGVGDRGLLVATPIVVLAVGAAVVLAREPGPWRRDASVALASFVTLVCVQAGGSMPPWGGESPGPRYVVAAMPFLAVPLAASWSRLRPLTPLVAAWSVAVMLLPTFTQPLLDNRASAIPTWIRLAGRGEFTPTIFSMAAGSVGVVVHLLLVMAAGAYLVREARVAAVEMGS